MMSRNGTILLAWMLMHAGTGSAAPATATPTPPAPPPAPVAGMPPAVSSYASPLEALIGGRWFAHLRLRHEHVDDDGRADEGNATTLRTTVGYRSGEVAGLSAVVEAESVLAAGNYDDGGANRRMGRYAQIVDPEGVELNQGYGRYTGLPGTTVQVGRQLVLDRESPFHRYLGNVVWRQNWQTHDAVAIEHTGVPNTRMRFWYSWNINRIFGEDNPLRGLDDKGLDGYLFNVQYTGFSLGKFEAYAYLLDFESPLPARGFYQSTQTYGARFDGKRPLNPKLDVAWLIEGAHQSDFADNPSAIDAAFLWGSLAATYKPGGAVPALGAKVSYEWLGGDGGADRFTTPLATGHAFQGWADQFLNTPGDGIKDLYLTGTATAYGFNFMIEWHDYQSDADDYDYGQELDVQLVRGFPHNIKAGVKYAHYDADRNPTNVARNAGQRNDVEKFWVWLEFTY